MESTWKLGGREVIQDGYRDASWSSIAISSSEMFQKPITLYSYTTTLTPDRSIDSVGHIVLSLTGRPLDSVLASFVKRMPWPSQLGNPCHLFEPNYACSQEETFPAEIGYFHDTSCKISIVKGYTIRLNETNPIMRRLYKHKKSAYLRGRARSLGSEFMSRWFNGPRSLNFILSPFPSATRRKVSHVICSSPPGYEE